jgi:asparagine synthase (glutamine-hydrolysing)
MRVVNGVRKRPLREVAARHLPESIAWQEKKAMQYGSGVMRQIERLAARRGYRKELQGYLKDICNKL